MPRATPGSAGLDLASCDDVIFSRWDGVSLVSTSTLGTLPQGTVGLIIGRSSNCKKNSESLSGVVGLTGNLARPQGYRGGLSKALLHL